jgi:hypothetical protein
MTRREYLTRFGRDGEKWFVGESIRRGFDATQTSGNHSFDATIRGNGLEISVEVKSALPSERKGNRSPRWQFSLRRKGLPIDEDLLILLCYRDITPTIRNPVPSPEQIYIIPGVAIDKMLTKIDIIDSPKMYAGKWSVYRHAWGWVDWALRNPRQERPEREIPF